jgi:hypothetical protein
MYCVTHQSLPTKTRTVLRQSPSVTRQQKYTGAASSSVQRKLTPEVIINLDLKIYFRKNKSICEYGVRNYIKFLTK